ncbi:MAG: GTPase ObgE [Rickettsiaceae bacterium]|nr:GTPase ObgE [Rickettsiaceae bacterium]
MHFIDEAKIFIKSGDGGNGSSSFRREKFAPMGGPDGGDGGRGASVIFKSSTHLNTLVHFRYKQHFKAESGKNGMGKNKFGKSADDLVIEVPVGTQIFSEDGEMLIYDFSADNQEFRILEGGRGGLGNAHFKTSTNQAPSRSTKGELGAEMWIWLKLKLLSDVGLVGMPNAGKSTFLSSVTSAKPKIADYPFTTLKPGLGVVKIHEDEFVLADIPGLIEGAHTGVGLGDNFLKHIERCSVIIHLIDSSSADVVKNYQIVRNELDSYSSQLSTKKEIVCLNKIDLISEDDAQEKHKLLSDYTRNMVYLVSAAANIGLTPLIEQAYREIQKLKDTDTDIV